MMYDGGTATIISTIAFDDGIGRGPLVFSHDGNRLLIPLPDRQLTAWDVATGQMLFELQDQRLLGYDWMTDNTTIVTLWWNGEREVLALFRVS